MNKIISFNKEIRKNAMKSKLQETEMISVTVETPTTKNTVTEQNKTPKPEIVSTPSSKAIEESLENAQPTVIISKSENHRMNPKYKSGKTSNINQINKNGVDLEEIYKEIRNEEKVN